MNFRFVHRPKCKGASMSSWVGHAGDLMIGCDSCRGFRVLDPDEAAQLDPREFTRPARAADEPTQSEATGPTFGVMFARVVLARFVCRDHLTPVSATGKGCTECAAEREQARRRRARKATRRAEREAERAEGRELAEVAS